MRRRDREITEFDEIVKVIEKCEVCRLALNDGEYPYILPLNFGMELIDGKITFYFHGAPEGKKYELIQRNNKASFEMDCSTRLVTILEDGNCTMEYESVIGQGTVEIVPDDQKERALDILMKHYHKEDFPYNKAVIPRTKVFKMTVERCTGKRRMKH
ncbi:MAG: pyridoxamine 5'-phosphate oxidase family protein [Firmicutes bacterium]|nr:pyridoxamine 5'-phosphate oxidase family protein [Bacillota bacterium]